MTHTSFEPIALPTGRIIGAASRERRRMLTCIDVVVGYVTAKHRFELAGWRIEAAFAEARPDFRGGETVALRVTPLDGCSPADLPPVPLGVLREIGSRIVDSFDGIANVVPDIASIAPDVDGMFAIIDDENWDIGGAQIA